MTDPLVLYAAMIAASGFVVAVIVLIAPGVERLQGDD